MHNYLYHYRRFLIVQQLYFSIDYLLYRNSIERQVREANKEFDERYLNMLIDEGWL